MICNVTLWVNEMGVVQPSFSVKQSDWLNITDTHGT